MKTTIECVGDGPPICTIWYPVDDQRYLFRFPVGGLLDALRVGKQSVSFARDPELNFQLRDAYKVSREIRTVLSGKYLTAENVLVESIEPRENDA